MNPLKSYAFILNKYLNLIKVFKATYNQALKEYEFYFSANPPILFRTFTTNPTIVFCTFTTNPTIVFRAFTANPTIVQEILAGIMLGRG